MVSKFPLQAVTKLMAVCALFLASCAAPDAYAEPGTMHKPGNSEHMARRPVNAKCPIMGGDVDTTGEMASFKEHKIGFCCPGCKPDWEAMSDEKKTAFVAAAMKK